VAIGPFKKVFLLSGGQVPLTRPPPGLAFMAGVCERVGVDYVTFDLGINFLKFCGRDLWEKVYLHVNTNRDLDSLDPQVLDKLDSYLEHVTNVVKESGCDCLSMSLLSYIQQGWTERFLQILKKASVSITIIAGGPGVCVSNPNPNSNKEIFGKYCADHDLVDFYVLGEGDYVFEEFLKGNVDHLGINTKHLPVSWQPQLDNLDLYASPSYKKIEFSGYETSDTGRISISVTGSRGCVRRCTFCDVGHIWKKYRYRNGQSISDEIIEHFEQTGVLDYWFTDSLINGSLKQFNDLISNFVQYKKVQPKLAELSYTGQFIIRPKQFHPEQMFQGMMESGCKQIIVGIESGSMQVRDHMGKKFSNEDIDWHFEMCEKYQIKNWLLLIVGYPTETEQDFTETKNLLIKNQRYILNHTVLGLNLQYMMSVLPNTPLESMSELGIHHIDDLHGAYINWHSDANPELTLARRYQRFAELCELAVDLRYNLPQEIVYFLQRHKNCNLDIDSNSLSMNSIIHS
jgi:radical SAM superfamily enzyme YgiQ (UPF0313 family)